MNTKYLTGISGLRAISIIFVILSHWGGGQLNGLAFTLTNGTLGVNIFFVISGYLITTLLIREETNNSFVSLKEFYIRGVLRIFPAYYFLLFLYFVLQMLNVVEISIPSWITSVTFTKYFPIHNGANDTLTFHFWSLSIEEHFYLLWPFIFKFTPKLRKHSLLLIVITIPLLRMLFYRNNMFWSNGDYSVFYRGDGIALGCLLAFYRETIVTFISRNKIMIYLPFMVLLFNLWLERFNIESPNQLHLGVFILPFAGSLGTITSLSIGLITIIVSNFNTYFGWLISTKPFEFIGKLSYSLYLYQQFFLVYYKQNIQNDFLLFSSLFVCALLSYYLIEKPFLKLKNKFIK